MAFFYKNMALGIGMEPKCISSIRVIVLQCHGC